MTEIKRDENGNVLCPLCGGILKASYSIKERDFYQNGEEDDYEITPRSVSCTKCGAIRSETFESSHGNEMFLSNHDDFINHFMTIREVFLKHSLS